MQRNAENILQKIKFQQVHTEQEWPIIELFLIPFAFVLNVWCKFTTDAHYQYQADEEEEKKKRWRKTGLITIVNQDPVECTPRKCT